MIKKQYTPEFKAEAIKLVTEQELSVSQAANDLGIGKSTLDKWVRVKRERSADPTTVSESELADLRARQAKRIAY